MSRKNLTRREFLSLSTKAGAGALLAAYGVGVPTAVLAAAPFAAATPVDLRFVWWGGQLRSDVTTRVVKMFETKHPYLKSTFEPLGFDKYQIKMTTQAARGGLPDVMQYGSSTNDRGVLQTLGMINGKMYGVSAGTNATGFVVDIDAFEQAGIKVPAYTWAWADFENVVKELHTKLGIWGFGVFQNRNNLSTVLSLMSLGECSCKSCSTKRKALASVRGPTPLALLST